MNMRRSLFCFLCSLPLFLSTQTVSAEEIANERFLADHPSVTEIGPGLYMVPTEGGSKVYGFGVKGMEFVVTKLDDIIESQQLSQDELEQAMASRDSLSEAISSYYVKAPDRSSLQGMNGNSSNPAPLASDSGTICQTVHYDLTANASRSGFWYLGGSATAGFQQWGGGPASPYPEAILHTFASSTGNGNTYAEYDTQSFSVNGFSYVTADPSSSTAGPSAGCMEAEALSFVHVPSCPGTNFKSVSESSELYCD